jgi:membrane fusion protein (multidrug efflux system)
MVEVPGDLDQNYSAIRQALGQLYRSASLLGFAPPSWVLSPKQALDVFERQDPERNLDRIFANLIAQAPSIKQAETKLQQARRDLALAELDLRYCDVRSEIDLAGISRRINPGNNVRPVKPLAVRLSPRSG